MCEVPIDVNKIVTDIVSLFLWSNKQKYGQRASASKLFQRRRDKALCEKNILYKNIGYIHTYINIASKLNTTSERDICVLLRCVEELQICGWYYDDITSEGAAELLSVEPTGTFIVRNSVNPSTLFSLSVKTNRGTTSVRIMYTDRLFTLDCDAKLRDAVPQFTSVLLLVDYYVRMSKDKRLAKKVWLESSGRKDVPVKITRPRLARVQTLKHLCRVKVNQRLKMVNCDASCVVTEALCEYMHQYPYTQ